MAYDTKELEKKAIEAIAKHRLFFISDVAPMIGISRQTFYDHGLDKLDDIKEALTKNRIEVKSSLRSKWYQSENPTLQLALMKLISTDEELKKLAMQYTESKNTHDMKLHTLSDDQVQEILEKRYAEES
jgi:hypothetical protein